MKKLLVIGGATATGKTALAIRLAQLYKTEILSADSRQFFREMSIGTAKPNKGELASAKHHFIDNLSIADDYSVGDFEREALEVLDDLFKTRDTAILVGGSGLYLKAVCEGLDVFPEIGASTKQLIEQNFLEAGLPWLQAQLQTLDPEYFAIVDQQNPARLRRAVEVCLETGQPFSSFRKNTKMPRPFSPTYILLDMPRADLYRRIDVRVDQMIASGLEAEARSVIAYREKPALKTVGYEELFDYFDGTLTREAAIEKIKQHSRNYAKRQITWFKKHGDWTSFHPEKPKIILDFLNA